jgi:hypothetical protein
VRHPLGSGTLRDGARRLDAYVLRDPQRVVGQVDVGRFEKFLAGLAENEGPLGECLLSHGPTSPWQSGPAT